MDVRSPEPRPLSPVGARWWAGGLTLAVTVAAVSSPAAVADGPTLCPFRRLTGLPCPTCGMTRSWVELAHGHVGAAFQLNPVAPLALLVAVGFVLTVSVRGPRGLPHRQLLTLLLSLSVAAGPLGLVRMVLVADGSWPWPY